MIWTDEQRAIGEVMIIEHPKGTRCMGYASFRREYAESLEPLSARVIDDLDDEESESRLRDVQHELCKLVRALDPKRLRYQDSDIQPGVPPPRALCPAAPPPPSGPRIYVREPPVAAS